MIHSSQDTISLRLQALRKEMKREHLGAFIFLSSDAHAGEYTPAHWQGREWISGFDGSAGVAVVTMSAAALWTDSRYFIAAEEQLRGGEYQLMREGLAGTPSIAAWLGKQLYETKEKEVGVDGTTAPYDYILALRAQLTEQGGLTLRTNFDPLERIWAERPALPLDPLFIHELRFCGERAEEKFVRVRQALRVLHADGTLVSTLDDIAWLLNLRGSDVHCNPVFVSYLLVTSKGATLFVDSRKLTAEVKIYLHSIGVATKEYNDVAKALKNYPDYSILLDPSTVNFSIARAVGCKHILYAPSPIPALKAVKNATEIEGFRRSMLRDGVAMVRFLYWLEGAIGKEEVSEMTVDEKLTALRAEGEQYVGLSFDTIAAYEEHGAIVHYEATAATSIPLEPHGFLLLDSGAQYKDGTTDITRTIALGPLTDEQRRIYTLVLKAHIQLEIALFPEGTTGTQLDALARAPLWREGLHFLHGTGHGVGAFLSVHEGPHQIRMQWRPAPLQAGMTVTDEPGVYLEGRFGVRIENTLLVKKDISTAFGQFLSFEPLTLCPIDTTPILRELLTEEERSWLNAYHARVYSALAPALSDKSILAWLEKKTQAI